MKYKFAIPEFLEWVVREWAPVGSMADRAAYSRSHFSRMFKRALGESPEILRLRLRLEAGAYLLRSSDWTVGEIAVEVGYETPEAFTKAFRSAYGVSPRHYRSTNQGLWLETATGIHFHPSGLVFKRQGAITMTFAQLLFEHHLSDLSTLIDSAAGLTNEQLEAVCSEETEELPFDPYPGTILALLDRLVYTQEVWLAALEGSPLPQQALAKGLESVAERHLASGAGLLRFVSQVDAGGLWESEFVDALCCPPQRFTYGGVLAHIIEFSAHRRQKAHAMLRKLGVQVGGYGDPINWHLDRTAGSLR